MLQNCYFSRLTNNGNLFFFATLKQESIHRVRYSKWVRIYSRSQLTVLWIIIMLLRNYSATNETEEIINFFMIMFFALPFAFPFHLQIKKVQKQSTLFYFLFFFLHLAILPLRLFILYVHKAIIKNLQVIISDGQTQPAKYTRHRKIKGKLAVDRSSWNFIFQEIKV